MTAARAPPSRRAETCAATPAMAAPRARRGDTLVTTDGAQPSAPCARLGPPALIEAAIACRPTSGWSARPSRRHARAYSTLRQYLRRSSLCRSMLPPEARHCSRRSRAARARCRHPRPTARAIRTASCREWRPHLVLAANRPGHLEISLAFAVRDALRAGSLFWRKPRSRLLLEPGL